MRALTQPNSQSSFHGKRQTNVIEETEGKEIYVGDILRLRKGDISPCDMMVLATSEQLQGVQVCRVDPIYVSGQSEHQVKEALSLTKSFNDWTQDNVSMNRFLKRLSAKVDYHVLSKSNQIKGKFKLKSDPREENFGEDHVIRTGAVVLSNYAVCLVLYNGRTGLLKDNNTVIFRKRNGIQNQINSFTVIFTVFSLFAAVITHLISERLNGENVNILDDRIGYIRMLCLYLSTFPVGVNLLLSLFYLFAAVMLERVTYVHKKKHEKDLKRMATAKAVVTAANGFSYFMKSLPDNSVPRKPSNSNLRSSSFGESLEIDDINSVVFQTKLKVLNPVCIPDLGAIDDAFFDKTGTLTGTEQRIRTVSMKHKVYRCTPEQNFTSSQGGEDPLKLSRILPNSIQKIAIGEFGSLVEFELKNEVKESTLKSQANTSAKKEVKEVHKISLKDEADIYEEPLIRRNPVYRFPKVGGARPMAQEILPPMSNPLSAQFDDITSIMKGKKPRSRGVSATRMEVAHNSEHTLPGEIAEVAGNEIDFDFDSKFSNPTKNLLFILSVCHNALQHNGTYLSDVADDVLLLNLAKEFGFIYEKFTEIPQQEIFSMENALVLFGCYTIHDARNVTELVEIVFINDYDPKRNRFSILIKDKTTGGGKLYVRGSDASMRSQITMTGLTSHYNNLLNQNSKMGLRSIVLGSKTFTPEETKALQFKHKAAMRNTIDQDGQLSALAKSIEKDLHFEAIIGVATSAKPDAKSTLETMQRMGINVHILSGDSEERCIHQAYCLGLLAYGEQKLELDFRDVDSGRSRVKNILEIVTKTIEKVNTNPEDVYNFPDSSQGDNLLTLESPRKALSLKVKGGGGGAGPVFEAKPGNIQSAKSFVVVISGQAMEIIEKDKYLYQHVMFIFEYGRTIIGYDFSAKQKAHVVKMFSKLERRTLAVGDGLNDTEMIKEAHVGIQVRNQHVKQNFGDLLVPDLESIEWLMRSYCRQWNESLQVVVHSIFILALTYFAINVIYQLYCNASGTSLLPSLYLCISGFFSVFVGLIYTFFTNRYPKKVRKAIKGLYCEKNHLSKLVHLKIFVAYFMPMAFVEGIFIVIVTLSCFEVQSLPEGQLLDLTHISIIIGTICIISYDIKIWCSAEQDRMRLFVLSLLITLGFGALLFLLANIGIFDQIFKIAFYSILKSWNSLAIILTLSSSNFILTYIVKAALINPKLFPIFNALERAVQFGEPNMSSLCQPSRWRNFLLCFQDTDPFSSTYRKCFDQASEVELSILNLLLGSDAQGKKAYSKLTMAFKTHMLYKKFSIYIANRFSGLYKIVLIGASSALALIFIFSSIFDQHIESGRVLSFFVIWCLSTGLYYACFCSQFSRKVNTYSNSYMIAFFLACIAYCEATKVDYTLLGTCVMVLMCLHYCLHFGHIFIMALFSLAGYVVTFWTSMDTLDYELFNLAMNSASQTALDTSSNRETRVFGLLSLTTLFVSSLIVAVATRRLNERLLKDEFLSGAKVDSNSMKAKELLSLLLPAFVLEKISNFSNFECTNVVLDNEDQVTILFCDIADFEDVVKKKENKVVIVLDRIFRKFDDLCLLHGIQKIETVGKTYMAAAGLTVVEGTLSGSLAKTHPTIRILNIAKDMMEVIRDFENLKLKIGIHVGNPVMGVIGYHKPQFSLIGDAVNTCSRHCVTGKKGHIMLSQEAWQVVSGMSPLGNGYSLQVVMTTMKGKGDLPVYHVFKKKNAFLERVRVAVARKDKGDDHELKHVKQVLNNLLDYLRNRQKKLILLEKLQNVFKSLMPTATLAKLKSEFIDSHVPVIKPKSTIVDTVPSSPSKSRGETMKKETEQSILYTGATVDLTEELEDSEEVRVK